MRCDAADATVAKRTQPVALHELHYVDLLAPLRLKLARRCSALQRSSCLLQGKDHPPSSQLDTGSGVSAVKRPGQQTPHTIQTVPHDRTFAGRAVGDDQLRQMVCHQERRRRHAGVRLRSLHRALSLFIQVVESLKLKLSANHPCHLQEALPVNVSARVSQRSQWGPLDSTPCARESIPILQICQKTNE